MRFSRKICFVTLVLSLFFITFMSSASAGSSFTETEVITVPEGFAADGFTAEFKVNSGKEGLPFYLWSWKIVNSNYNSVYHYYDKSTQPEQTGALSELVLGPGKYCVYVDKGDNKSVSLKIKYSMTNHSLRRYALPSRHLGYTVYFDKKEKFSSGKTGYFRVKDGRRPYYFVETPSYIMLDDTYTSRYFSTPDGYYIFEGKDNAPILFDKDDKVVIIDNGNGNLVIIEDDGI